MQLYDYLSETGTSVAAFAERLGVYPKTVYRWLNNEQLPDREHMVYVIDATAGVVTPNDFFAAELGTKRRRRAR